MRDLGVMRSFSNKPLSIPSFSVNDIKDERIQDKSIIEKLVKNMVLVKNGIYLEKIYDVKTFRGSIIERAAPNAVEIDSFYISRYPITQKEWTLIMGYDPSSYDVQDED